MAIKTWLGTTDADFDTAANWDPAGVPADDDTLLFSDRSSQALTGAIDVGTLVGKKFQMIATPGFKYYIGASGSEFSPADGLTTVIWRGTGVQSSYLEAVVGKTFTRVIVDSPAATENNLILNGAGSTDQIAIKSGKVKLTSTTLTSGGRADVLGGAGSTAAELLIDSGCTLTGTYLGVMNGRLKHQCSANVIRVHGGELVIDGGHVDIALLEMFGGVGTWDAYDLTNESIITKLDAFGGTFRIRKDMDGRTLTNMDYHTGAIVDFTVGGLNVAYTNAPRNLGGLFKTPMGASITVGI